MNHDYYIERLSGYHDQNLPLEEMELLRRHLADCPECMVALAEYEKLDRLVEKQGGLDGSDEYWESLANKIESKIATPTEDKITEISPGSYRGLGWKFTAVAASFAIIGFVALYQEDILDSALDEVRPPVGKTEVLKRLSDKPPVKIEGAGQAASRDSILISSAEKLSKQKIKAPEKVMFTPNEQVDAKLKDDLIAPGKRARAKDSRIERIDLAETDRVELQRLSKKEIPRKSLPVLEEAIIEADQPMTETAHFQPSSLSQPIVIDTIATRSLTDWQFLRDSVRAGSVYVQALDKLGDEPDKGLKKKVSTTNFGALQSADAEIVAIKQPADSLFLLAYYNVGRITTDSTERNRSIRFLENYLLHDKPFMKKQAEVYLEELRKIDLR